MRCLHRHHRPYTEHRRYHKHPESVEQAYGLQQHVVGNQPAADEHRNEVVEDDGLPALQFLPGKRESRAAGDGEHEGDGKGNSQHRDEVGSSDAFGVEHGPVVAVEESLRPEEASAE